MNRLHLTVVATDSYMVLPRILQLLSRRGWRLVGLATETHENHVISYACEMEGDAKWNELLPLLIAKLADVREVSHDK